MYRFCGPGARRRDCCIVSDTVDRHLAGTNRYASVQGMYMMFCKEKRGKVVADNPGLSVAQVGKALGEQWRAMTDKEKEKFRAMADADKVRYEKEMSTYNS